ncbi:sensor histidine kinase [Chitinophaga sancti]|uniref:Oxygen sensor histidine kinase NreB n=1 Tax=Chitinophaga sancti TaxID=1004 RepID=A0A1K1RTX9_9BACT|nr:ATP-binding protein [Chitinophaga sancti]WQD62419.1 histidine kinase [Chitinophaga sancti]WQG92012.1 histidine kinase [Chitinophaga sancti]SFW75268.1 Histidine kinase-, DNA gyrase B-, and HSP90-like ATPase [Chitinophaga sancti]
MSTHLFTNFIPSIPLQAVMHFYNYESGDIISMLPLIGMWSIISVFIFMLYKIERYKKKEFMLLNRIHEQQEHELDIQEAERRRIAEDLHDEIGSSLAAIRMNLQSLSYNSVHDEQRATSLLKLVDQTSQNVRRATHNLIPPHFETTPFTSILQSYFSSLDSGNTIAFQYYCNAYQHCFSTRQELLIYRIVIELTHNIIRHAQASEASIQLLFCPTYLEIMVEDNGIGLPPAIQQGIGLNSVHSRVRSLAGKIHIDSGRGGTTFIIHVPVSC